MDFARKFDSITKLWKKLNVIGVPSKLIRILKDIYEQATMTVRTANGYTKRYEVAEGVLQGELTSPLLFSLYISDIDDIFKALEANGVRGININHKTVMHVLAYADDMVILADSPTQLQKKLDALHEYCSINGLTVNVSKTKILIFHHQHKSTLSGTTFLYGKNEVEVVMAFTYLGVTFCTCGGFHAHVNAVKVKCAAATKTLLQVIDRSRTSCWSSMMRLKEAMLLSIPLYASEVWGFREIDEVEKIQLTFMKRLLHLPKTVPGYMLRMETGTRHISHCVLRRSLAWRQKVLQHDSNRLTYVCLSELAKLSDAQTKISSSNWVTKIHSEIKKLGIPYVSHIQTVNNWDYIRAEDLVSCYVTYNDESDMNRCDNSSYSSFYHRLKANNEMEKYLSLQTNLQNKRLFCNLRLHADRLPFLSILANHVIYKFTPTKKCPLCGCDNDDLFHALCMCRHYKNIRLPSYSGLNNRRQTHKLFQTYSNEVVGTICRFVTLLLRQRAFLLGD